ncbi:MAG: anti-sigma factor [Gloeobacteraceae cyanobacterium ES-bin-144]|nr:anti-sigma factor [Verrucomicrobiales bacterium]
MISESQEEQASLYVFGLLPKIENAEFEAELSRNVELSNLVASLSDASVELARSIPKKDLSPQVRARLLESVSGLKGNVVPLRRGNHIKSIIPWAAAACLVGLLYVQSDRAGRERSAFQSVIANRETELVKSQNRVSTLEISAEAKQREFAAQLATAEAARMDLLARVNTLEQKDILAQTKIAVLGSQLKDRPQAMAVSLWNQERQDGLLVVENLPVLEAGKDYQLWVLDPSIAAPVSAGVFKVDAEGKVRITFKPNQAIANAAKFAVSLEAEGGVLSPTMDQIVVIGGS